MLKVNYISEISNYHFSIILYL